MKRVYADAMQIFICSTLYHKVATATMQLVEWICFGIVNVNMTTYSKSWFPNKKSGFMIKILEFDLAYLKTLDFLERQAKETKRTMWTNSRA